MSEHDDLFDCIQKVVKIYPNRFVIEDLYDSDAIRIRKKGQGEQVKTDDVVGTYSESQFEAGKITTDSVRKDIQAWLQKHGSKV